MTNVLLLVWDTFINFVAVCLSFLLGTPKSHLGLHPSSWKIESLWLLLYNLLLPWELFFLLFSCLWAPHHCLNWFRLHSHLSLVWCVWLSLILIQIVLWFFFFFLSWCQSQSVRLILLFTEITKTSCRNLLSSLPFNSTSCFPTHHHAGGWTMVRSGIFTVTPLEFGMSGQKPFWDVKEYNLSSISNTVIKILNNSLYIHY